MPTAVAARRAAVAGPNQRSSSRTAPRQACRPRRARRAQFRPVAATATAPPAAPSADVPGERRAERQRGGEEPHDRERACPTPGARGRCRGGPRRTRRPRPRRPPPGPAPGPAPRSRPPPRTATSSATSRLSHDRRRLRSAFHAAIGRPRWPEGADHPGPRQGGGQHTLAGRARGGAHPEGDLAEEREPDERPVGFLGAQVPVAGGEGLERHVARQLDAGGRQR